MSIEQMAIESTYYHLATINRHEEYKDKWGETKEGLFPVFEDIRCAVSQSAGMNVNQTDPRNVIEYNVKLFCSPSLLILPGDKVTATFENGLIREYEAGEAIPYPYHQEIPLIREDEA